MAEPREERAEPLQTAARKINWRLLPPLSLLSIICYLDRANLAFAAKAMNQDLGFTTATYGLGSGLFFIGYALFQVPSNMAIARVGGPLWLSLICTAWGIVAGCFAAINSRGAFLALRCLLGVAEAGALPGMWFYVAQFYPPPRLTVPMTLVMAGITVAQVIGAPLAAGFLAMHGAGGLAGWRWLFLLEAIPAVLLGLSLWFLLPGSIATAAFLTTEERQALQGEMQRYRDAAAAQQQQQAGSAGPLGPKGAAAQDVEGSKAGSEAGAAAAAPAQPEAAAGSDGAPPKRSLADDWASLRVALRCATVWCGGAWRCLYAMAVYGLQYFTPLIVGAMLGSGTSSTEVTLLSAIPYAAAALFHICNALHSTRTGERRLHIALPWLAGGVFMAVLPSVTRSGSGAGALVVLTLASMGVNGADGPDVAWLTTLLSHEERLLGLPSINMLANVGGFVGPYIIGALNTASGNYDAAEWVMAGCILAASLMVMAFPLRWATVQPQRLEPGGGGSKGTPAPQRTVSGLLLAAMSSGDVLLSCPQAVQSKLLPELEAAGSRQAYRAATFGGFGAAVRAALPWGAAAEHSGDMQRMTTV